MEKVDRPITGPSSTTSSPSRSAFVALFPIADLAQPNCVPRQLVAIQQPLHRTFAHLRFC